MTEALTLAQRLHDRAKWRGTIRNRADIELDREAADALDAKDAEFQHFQKLASEHRAELETEIARLREANKALETEVAVQRECKEHARAQCDAAEAKLAKVKAERDRAESEAQLHFDQAMSNGNDRARLAAQAKEALEALSDALDDQGNPDSITFPDNLLLHNGVSITFGDCRRARTALASLDTVSDPVRETARLPRPDTVSMTCGTICLEYSDYDLRDLAYD